MKNKTYYNVNFTTNDWEKLYAILIKHLPKNVYISDFGVWKNRNLLDEYGKLTIQSNEKTN